MTLLSYHNKALYAFNLNEFATWYKIIMNVDPRTIKLSDVEWSSYVTRFLAVSCN